MLLAVGPNPTIDRILHVPEICIGTVHRATRVELGAGGKGLNTTRVASILGYPVLTTGPMAGHSGRLLADLAAADGLPADWYWLEGVETRLTTLIHLPAGDTTVFNEPGPTMSEADWQGFAGHITRLAEAARAVAFCGSVLPGVQAEALGELARLLAAGLRHVYVDSSGLALAAVLERPAGLCVKVNRAELAGGLGREPADLSLPQLRAAGQMLLERGATLVVVTLGGEGAVAIAPEGAWHARPPALPVVSTVGSGDSLLAGLALSRLDGRGPKEALAYGVACGAANALTAMPGRLDPQTVQELLPRVALTPL